MSHEIAGCIAWELMVIFFMMISSFARTNKKRWAIVMFGLPFAIGVMTIYAVAESPDDLKKSSSLFGIFAIFYSVMGLYCIISGRYDRTHQNNRWISLKSGEFKVVARDICVPGMLKRFIVTRDEVISCISDLPDENVDIDVCVSQDERGNLTCQSFQYRQKRPWTASRITFTAVWFLTCICGVLIAPAFMIERRLNGIIAEENSPGMWMVLISLFGLLILILRYAKQDSFYKFFYYVGWLGFSAAMITLLCKCFGLS